MIFQEDAEWLAMAVIKLHEGGFIRAEKEADQDRCKFLTDIALQHANSIRTRIKAMKSD